MLPDFDRTYFEDLYARCPDPWGYESSAYEHAKYAMTMGALPRATYHSVLEFGCSIGVLTQRLSAICDKLVGIDTSSRALDAARLRCPYPHVDFLQTHLPRGQWSTGYDLAVLSEVLYTSAAPPSPFSVPGRRTKPRKTRRSCWCTGRGKPTTRCRAIQRWKR